MSLPARERGAAHIGDATLRQFEAGVTTEAWLYAILGAPTSRATVEGIPGARVLRYGATAGDDGRLMAQSPEDPAIVYFIVMDGVVVRFWADRGPDEPTLTGVAEERIRDLMP